MTAEWRKDPPSGCVTVEEHERKFLELAEKLEAAAAKLLEPNKAGDVVPMNLSRAKELGTVAVRARRSAADLAVERERNEHIDWLDAQRAKMREHSRGGAVRTSLSSHLQIMNGDKPDGAA